MRSRLMLSVMLMACAATTAAQNGVQLPAHKGESWWTVIKDGGMRRRGAWFVNLPEGLVPSLMSMDYANGYNFGPSATFGHVNANYSRWEADEMVRWSASRETLMARGALRYYWRPETLAMLELHGGRTTTDFDRQPLMPAEHALMATGIFGWNGYKLYDRTDWGIATSLSLSADIQLKADVAWERRSRVDNHRKRNVFRVMAEDNIPRLRGHDHESWMDDRLLNFEQHTMCRADLRIEYTPQRTILVIDDMTAMQRPSLMPTIWSEITVGKGSGDRQMMSVEAGVTRYDAAHSYPISYHLGAGLFVSRRNVALPDYRHFDCAYFPWQQEMTIRWFSLLSNYELSTDRSWAEAHCEWLTDRLLFGRLAGGSGIQDAVQLHLLKVEGHTPHEELSYAVQLLSMMRIGLSVGWDGHRYDGVAFNLVLDLKSAK